MEGWLSITALARRTGVSSRTLRYWERRGLLPRAARTRAGYRLFPPLAERQVRFILRARTLGLTLAEMAELLALARAGRCPCPQVIAWTEQRIEQLGTLLVALRQMRQRLVRLRRQWGRCGCSSRCTDRWCELIADLPELQTKGGTRDETLVVGRRKRSGRSDAQRAARAGAAGGTTAVLPAMPAGLPALRGLLTAPVKTQRRGPLPTRAAASTRNRFRDR